MKWYITGGRTEHGVRDDGNVEPLVSYGKDRVEALAHSGITVWSEDEYAEMKALLSRPEKVCGKCGGTGEVCFSSTNYGPCPECVGRER
jgi:hypothetical protein